MNYDKTSFLCNEGKINIIGSKNKPLHQKNCSDERFSITVLLVGSAAGANFSLRFLETGTNVHPRLRGNKLVTRYGLLEVSCVIPKKAAYMYDDTWEKVLKVVASGIKKLR